MIKAVLTDIEGTTSSISFVKDVLFPYARERITEFVALHGAEPEIRKILSEAKMIAGESLEDAELCKVLIRWIDEDRKVTPLKSLQGLIWEEGYRHGDFHGHIHEDAVRRLRAWKNRGLRLYVFSSGSVYAQKLLFGHTQFGDLTALFSGYFDTHVGPKQDPGAYRKIAAMIGLEPAVILFLSDIEGELDAARTAGMVTIKVVRGPELPASAHPQVGGFDAITFHERL
ncbi:MAG: acireductone synthase [Methylotetracoccus sp.]|jgi:enolase-phosphatase E1|nr:acireductone synthase [Methylotetracoccus sp.]